MNTKIMIPFLLIIGILSFMAAFYLYKKQNKNLDIPIEQSANENNLNEDSVEKGKAFEEYVIDLFLKQKEIELVSRVSDYYKNGKFAKENQTPDLKMLYQNKSFAIECKFRQQFVNESINWAKEYQIQNYNAFEKQNNTKVFIAIGVGGLPSKPEELYIVPLYRLTKTYATKDYIKEFRIIKINYFLNKILSN